MNLEPRACGLAALCFLAAAPAAQQQDPFVHVPLRVTSAANGAVVVDRGTRDALDRGDRVLLFPRAGGTYRGSVVQCDERSAVVELDEKAFTPEPGTRGEVLVPRARTTRTEPPTEPPVEPAVPDHAPWEERADGWQDGMPLLARVRPVRPEERDPRLSGRIWMLGDVARVPSTGESTSNGNTVGRLGTYFRLDNPFARGGALEFDGELDYTTARDADDATTRPLVRTLSYAEGGTRFAPDRWQLGRFLQTGRPEFGILDGFEWNHRTDAGHRFGASVGFLPNPDDDLATGDDFQLAVQAHWSGDELERLSADFGYQKTFHDGEQDRDLFVLGGRWLPDEHWDLYANAWIDGYFGPGDAVKSSPFEVTQAIVSARRRGDDGSELEFTYRRYRFPWTERDEFEPTTIVELVDDHSDRLAVRGSTAAPGTARVFGELAGWADEDDAGGYAELGCGFVDVLFEGAVLDVTGFGSIGAFETLVGGRLALGRATALGRWDLLYEFADHRLDDRPADADDLLQHRLRASHSFWLGNGWTWSLHGDASFWDDDLAWSAGFHAQKSF